MSAAILYLTSEDYAPLTGGHIYNTHLITALSDQGHAPEVMRLKTGFPDIPADEREMLLAKLGGLVPDTVLLMDHVYLCRLHEDLRDLSNPVAVIFHHSDVMEHGRADDAQGQRLFATEQAALARADAIIVTSGETARYIRTHYRVEEQRIRVAVPGLALAPRGLAGKHDGVLKLLSVGALIPRKRYGLIIAAAALLGDLNWQWNIVGDPHRYPDHVQQLRAEIETAGLGQKLRILGDVANDALARLRAEADLCVAASAYEGYGMAIAEALRYGIPVVTTASGAVSTWVGAGVMQVSSDEPAALATAIQQLAMDREKLATLAQDAWRFGHALPTWEETFEGIADWLLASKRFSFKGNAETL